MANKRLPDNVLRMQGTYRKDRHGDPDKKPLAASSKAPTCPSWLPASAKAEYRRVVKALAEYGILTPLDRGIMAQYAVLHAHMVDSPETFNAALHGQYRLIQVELGFTPSSRSKLDGLRQDDDDDGDPLA
jgi:phage terminase small subunit